MSNGENGMPSHHPAAGIAHYVLHLIAHFSAVAVYRALIAGGLILEERTLLEPLAGVFGQFPAFGTESRNGFMQIPAVEPDH